MRRRKKRLILLKAAMALFVMWVLVPKTVYAAEVPHHPAYSGKPNIILILTDDQGWADLSRPIDPRFSGATCTLFHTANMNALAESGMRFTDAYAPAPICTPTRRSIQFGMTPARQHGTEFLGHFDPAGKWSIARALKHADPDYQCAHFGKWGGVITGTWSDRESQLPGSPDSLGYDLHDGMNGNGHGTFYNRGDPNQYKNTICEADDDPKRILTVTDKAISFITRQADRKNPFYLQVSYFAIHTAFQAKQETLNRYAESPDPDRKVARGIAPMLEDLDMAIGRLLDHVEMLGISDRTYVFFTSDNGGEHHHIWNEDAPEKDRNHPLRMYKQTLYEGGIRVPFIVKGPGISGGTICREPVCGYDLLPTFYELAGGKGTFPQKLDGGSLFTLLFNEGSGHIVRPYEGLFFHRPNPKSNRIGGHSAYREGKYKLLVFWTDDREVKRTELYDLENDIAEQSDLSGRMPEKTRELQGKLLEYLYEVND